MEMLNKTSPIPLYFQMKEDIVEKIQTGAYKAGDSLPPEKALMDMYGVSRTTVRQAVEMLVNEGYLEKRRGIGTFVRDPKVNYWNLTELQSNDEVIQNQGHKSSTKILSLKLIPSNPELEKIFGASYDTFYHLERLRFLDDNPFVLVSTYVPAKLVPGLERFDFSKCSLFDIMWREYGVKIVHAEKTLRAGNISAEDAKILDVEEGSAILLVETITNDEEKPVEYSLSRDRGDISRYKINLKRAQF